MRDEKYGLQVPMNKEVEEKEVKEMMEMVEDEFVDGDVIMKEIQNRRDAIVEIIPEEVKAPINAFLAEFVYFNHYLEKVGYNDPETVRFLFSIYQKNGRIPEHKKAQAKSNNSQRKPSEKMLKYADYLFKKYKPEDITWDDIKNDYNKCQKFIKEYANKGGQ